MKTIEPCKFARLYFFVDDFFSSGIFGGVLKTHS
jgi:hypothetical protein